MPVMKMEPCGFRLMRNSREMLTASLLMQYETGNPAAVEEAAKSLERMIKSEAKDIHDKYIEPPYTTDFGIMFLPFEGLYAEVVRRGLLETLQREYKVNIAGTGRQWRHF